MSETSLLVVEHGGSWIDWARSLRKDDHMLVMVAQQPGEDPQYFFDRVQKRIDILSLQSANLERVVLVGGSFWSGPALLSRARMVRALLSRLRQRAPETKLVLDGGSKDSQAALGMKAIAEAISECVEHAPSHLRLVAGPSAIAA